MVIWIGGRGAILVPTAPIAEPDGYAQFGAADTSYAAAKVKMANIRKYVVCPLLFGQIGLSVANS
jgi:hypothetical protein